MTRKVIDLPWECGKGWWPLIEKVAAVIDSFNAAHPDSPVEVTQIKQKFGGLRIYHYNAPEDIRQLIDETIDASWHTCEHCGATEGVTTNQEGYRNSLCPNCRQMVKPRVVLKERARINRNRRKYTP
jgi:hypothetical protein